MTKPHLLKFQIQISPFAIDNLFDCSAVWVWVLHLESGSARLYEDRVCVHGLLGFGDGIDLLYLFLDYMYVLLRLASTIVAIVFFVLVTVLGIRIDLLAGLGLRFLCLHGLCSDGFLLSQLQRGHTIRQVVSVRVGFNLRSGLFIIIIWSAVIFSDVVFVVVVVRVVGLAFSRFGCLSLNSGTGFFRFTLFNKILNNT